jgi:hypothetical protein
MKLLAVIVLVLVIYSPAHAQCNVPGCDAATAVVADGRAKGAAILTAAAPPTWTPAPSSTPWPTMTPTQPPTATPWPTDTPQPTATATQTPQPPTVAPIVATAAARVVEATAPANTPPAKRSTVGDDLLILAMIIGLIVAGGAWYLYTQRRK